jgi:hypothetical protein
MSKNNVIDFGTFSLAKEAANGIAVTIYDERTREEFIGLDGNPIVIKIQGMDSDLWQKKAKQIGERNAVKYKRRGAPSHVVEENLREILATATLSWTENIPFNGKSLECTFDNAFELYKMPNAIAEQLIAAGTNRQLRLDLGEYLKQRAWFETRALDKKEVRGNELEEVDLPDITGGEYLIEFVYRIGPRSITWADLNAWCVRTDIQLSGWESETIKKLCDLYESSANEYSDKDIPPPFVQTESAKNVSSNIQSILRRPIK